jgi:CxxC-x17-CxxC domain-containing protein
LKDEAVTRVVVPVAIVTGTVHLRGGPPDAVLVSAALGPLGRTKGGKLPRNCFPFPSAMTAELVRRGLDRGQVRIAWDNPRTASQGSPPESHQAWSPPSAVAAAEEERIDTAWAVDLVLGLSHPFPWVIQNELTTRVETDVPIAPRFERELSIEAVRRIDLRRLVRNMSPPRMGVPAEKRNEWKREAEDRADRVEDLAVARFAEVAIPLRHHEKGKAERWLVGSDPPPSMLACLRQSVPQLLELKINTQDLRLGYARSPALQLLEGIDDLWEASKWTIWKTTSKGTRQLLARQGLETVSQWLDGWQDSPVPPSDVEDADVCVGPAEEQGEVFRKLSGTVRQRIVVLTSFLNPKYADWVASLFSRLPEGTKILLLYGHANDEDSEARETTARQYGALLSKRLIPGLQLEVRSTMVRSHEKIVVTDSSWVMLGSWNIGSSFPHASYLEGSFRSRSRTLAADVLDLLSEEADEEAKAFLDRIRSTLDATEGRAGQPLRPRLEALRSLFQSILEEGVHEVRDWRKVREQLTALRDVLWTHFASPRVELVRGGDLRDVLMEQVSSATHSVTLATDRVNETGLDASFAKTLRLDNNRVRILWGLEDPTWRIPEESPDARELEAAGEVLHLLLQKRPANLRSSEKPMANHAKLLIVDEDRLLIGSDNFLAHGRERGNESSREVALLVEHPLLARRALGSMLLERPELWFPSDTKNRDLPWELLELLRRQVESLSAAPDLENAHNSELLEFAAESTFRDFAPEGGIRMDASGRPVATNPKLSARWDEVLQTYGKGRSQLYFEELCKKAHESGFIQLVWNPDRTFSLFPIGSQPPLAPRPSIERDSEGLGSGVGRFCQVLEKLESEPFTPVSEVTVLKAAQEAFPWLRTARWGMDEDRFLSFLQESGRILRLPGGTCRRLRESERSEFRRQGWSGPIAGIPNATCRKCGRSFRDTTLPDPLPESPRPLPSSTCLECRAELAARQGERTLREHHRTPAVVRDPESMTGPGGLIAPSGKEESVPLAGRFKSECSICKVPVDVPFSPDGVRPVYCRRHIPKLVSGQAPEYHEAVCSSCGATIRVPFIPTKGRPVYCRLHLPNRPERT